MRLIRHSLSATANMACIKCKQQTELHSIAKDTSLDRRCRCLFTLPTSRATAKYIAKSNIIIKKTTTRRTTTKKGSLILSPLIKCSMSQCWGEEGAEAVTTARRANNSVKCWGIQIRKQQAAENWSMAGVRQHYETEKDTNNNTSNRDTNSSTSDRVIHWQRQW